MIGNNNYILIEDNVSFKHTNIRLKGNDITLKIGKNVEFTGGLLSAFQNTTTIFEESSTFGNGEFTVAEEKTLFVGKDCMFAHGYDIRTSDMHPIYSRATGERLNHGKDIYIGNHIWLGRNVTILKGSYIADDTVVGTGSVVCKKHDTEHCVISGSPAQLIKEDVVWGRKMYHEKISDDPTLSGFLRKDN
ncbi:hypothetical protein BCT30_21535 [Enterovibrio norvegicus]|uniref:acyltransferase n=1 Tax=Enterovibrio norvegicus TaxID=188144 RepID=UPI000CAB8A85|nr:acyltransferase [Enterovibrio norvegicus]PMI35239.1 hypothetical protein BCU46_19060 [Enterovibrio norvegicus]PMN47117.1 hypothetical protein BCT30_21535 [Enterovibrio norvegicus]